MKEKKHGKSWAVVMLQDFALRYGDSCVVYVDDETGDEYTASQLISGFMVSNEFEDVANKFLAAVNDYENSKRA